MSEQQRYFFTQDNDSHWYLIPANKRAEFDAWLEHQEKLWGDSSLSDEEFKRIDAEYTGEDFNDYRTGGSISDYTFENPKED